MTNKSPSLFHWKIAGPAVGEAFKKLDRRVTVSGKEVSFTATEYNLLRLLVRHAGKVLTHRFLLREIWGPNAENQNHYLRVYMARLREKIETDPSRPSLLLTEAGIGYRLVEKD